jgi:hypothetical protein
MSKPSTKITRPHHYVDRGIEPIDYIESWDMGCHISNVIKYVTRAPYKGNELEDLQKARWYLDRYISLRAKRDSSYDLEESVRPTLRGELWDGVPTCSCGDCLGRRGEATGNVDPEVFKSLGIK